MMILLLSSQTFRLGFVLSSTSFEVCFGWIGFLILRTRKMINEDKKDE